MANNRLEKLVERLRSDDEHIREGAADELRTFGMEGRLSNEESLYALKAATQSFPKRKFSWQDTASDLILAAASRPGPEHIHMVLEIFSDLTVQARNAALNLLSRIKDRQAALAYMDIVHTYAQSDELSKLNFWHLRMPFRHIDVFFPALLEYVSNPKLSPAIYEFCLDVCDQGLLNPDILVDYTSSILTSYLALRDSLMPQQQSEGVGWMWADDYLIPREECGVLLDLMGYVKTPEIITELTQALAFADTKLLGFVVISLLRQGHDVERAVIRSVASDPTMRIWIYEMLTRLEKLPMFPEDMKTQEAFAESDMVGWLTFGTELGRAPDEIELMKTISLDTETEQGILDYFVFRFRTFPPHWAAKDGWMAGVSGPFLRKDSPSARSYGETFSSFSQWESATAEEHLGDVHEILQRWREYHSEG
jgi:hypothetical protein